MYNILTVNKISEAGISQFEPDMFNISDSCPEPDGILVRSADLKTRAFNSALKAVARAGAGVENIPVDKCAENGIVVLNTPGANANGVKELVIAALLLSSRKILEGVAWTKTLTGAEIKKTVEAGKSAFKGCEIASKRVGVFGLGAIGVLVANACRALGMEVVGYDPFMTVNSAWNLSRGVKKAGSLNELLAACDYLTVHAPLSPDTSRILNKKTISHMKDGVKVLNFARGELADDDDILEAVANKKISVYVTDFPSEKLINRENIITIPHLGASTDESEENCAHMAASQLKDYLLYGNIINSVNFPDCEMPPSGAGKRICVFNKNIPDVIGGLSKIISAKNINIENMLNKSRGKYSYTMIDVSEEFLNGVSSDLAKVEGVIRIRII